MLRLTDHYGIIPEQSHRIAQHFSPQARLGNPYNGVPPREFTSHCFFRKLIAYIYEIQLFANSELLQLCIFRGLIQPMSSAKLESKDGGRDRQ